MAILCRVTRGDLTESIHVAFAVVVDNTGNIMYSSGDPYYLTCIRSSLKPFQAAAVIKSGAVEKFKFEDKEIALMCASHQGESFHVETVRSMLKKLNFEENNFECGSHYPSKEDVKIDLILNRKKITPIYNNCSGKHTGMLALAKYLKVDKKGYFNKDHAVQKYILQYIKHLSGIDNFPLEIDGCSVPTLFMTLEDIAKLYQKLAEGSSDELIKVFDAISKYPEFIGGTNNFDSLFIEALNGRGITKIGAESVRGISLKTKKGPIGIALKILDGNNRALPLATISLLKYLKLLDKLELKKLDKFETKILKNHNGFKTGKIEVIIED